MNWLDTGGEKYLHTCPQCGSPAYVGLTFVECSYKYCRHHPTLHRLGVVTAEIVERLWRRFDGADDPDADPILSEIRRLIERHERQA